MSYDIEDNMGQTVGHRKGSLYFYTLELNAEAFKKETNKNCIPAIHMLMNCLRVQIKEECNAWIHDEDRTICTMEYISNEEDVIDAIKYWCEERTEIFSDFIRNHDIAITDEKAIKSYLDSAYLRKKLSDELPENEKVKKNKI